MTNRKITKRETIIRQLMTNDLNETVFGVQNLRTSIVGDSGTGKSTILKVLKSGALLMDLPRVLDSFWIDLPTMKPGKIDCHMLICDTDGRHTKIDDRKPAYETSDVIIICFAIDNPLSFTNVKKKWFAELQMFCPSKPFILVGNKSDIRLDKKRLLELENMGSELVTELDAINLHEELGAHCYIEASAYCNIGVKSPFQEAVAATWPKVTYKFEDDASTKSSSARYCTIL